MKLYLMSKPSQENSLSPKRTARFQSVKAISNKQLMVHPRVSEQVKLTFLDKLFDKQNSQESPIQDQKVQIPNEQKQTKEIKLWDLFLQKIADIGERVEKEKVHIWEVEIDRIMKEIQKKLKIAQQSVKKVQKHVQSKYKVIHGYFNEIKLAKIEKRNMVEKTKAKKDKEKDLYYKERVGLINNNILEIKKQIQEQETLLSKTQADKKEIEQDRLMFLKKLLKQGYYRSEGIKWFLNRLIEIDYEITTNDLPNILDDSSKQYVINQVKRMKLKQRKQLQLTQRIKLPQINARGRSVSTLVPISSQRTKSIYQQTKELVEKRIKSKNWEESVQQRFFEKPLKSMLEWRVNEKKRIKYAYSGPSGEKVFRILFGTRLQKSIQ